MDKIKIAISGFVSGTISSVLCYPLQSIQIQMQVSETKNNTLNIIKNIYQKQGFKGYYNGMSKGILGYSIFYGTYFLTYDYLKETTELHPFFTSYLASAVGSIISNPWHVLRVRKQTCILKGQTHINPTIRSIYKEEGFNSLTKGIKSSLLKNVELGFIMTIYEKLKNDYNMNPFYASFIGKMTSSIVTYPLDSIRNIRRYEPINYIDIIYWFISTNISNTI
jgi:hypothetical protein